jgi:hypothetical protein
MVSRVAQCSSIQIINMVDYTDIGSAQGVFLRFGQVQGVAFRVSDPTGKDKEEEGRALIQGCYQGRAVLF